MYDPDSPASMSIHEEATIDRQSVEADQERRKQISLSTAGLQ
jgi:hypothetical protein